MHSLSIVKVFMLAAAVANALPSNLESRQAGGRTLVPGFGALADPPVRKEIRTLSATELNIFYLALELMQKLPDSDMKSFYRVGGIHGTAQAWDGDNGGSWGTSQGYCRHGDRAFPTWHRPYLSLYEKTLSDLAKDAVSKWPAGPEKTAHEAALASWRLPYWDWAQNAAIPASMGADGAGENVSIVKLNAQGRVVAQSSHNPLASYIFPRENEAIMRIREPNAPNARTRESLRNPRVNGQYLVNQHGHTNDEMREAGLGLRTAVFDMFSSETRYGPMSNTQEGRRSLEQVHGSVHVILGGWRSEGEMQGHMFYPAMAGFDPIFYLHHANVDRLLALWQAIYPNEYLPETGGNVNANSALHPFRKSASEYWTSKTSRDVKAFGYTYPELKNGQNVRNQVATLYGPSTPARTIADANTASRKARFVKRQDDGTNDKLHTPPNIDDLAAVVTDAVLNSTTPAGALSYNDYTCNIKAPSDIAGGSFRVLIFFGEPTGTATEWTQLDNYVGSFDVFAPASGAMKMTVQGSVGLTNAFLNLAAAKKIEDLKPETVQEYLKQNLKYKLNDGKISDAGVKVVVETAKVTVPADAKQLPVWGPISVLFEATK